MKHTSFVILSAALAWTFPLRAADDIHTHWVDLCHAAGSHQLNVTTTDGKTVSGTCTSTSDNEIALTANQSVVKIARATLIRIQMYEPGNHHLADLGNGMAKSFNRGFAWLFSPAAPLGLVTIPATIAWGAVAAPFCLLGDMGGNGPTARDVKVID